MVGHGSFMRMIATVRLAQKSTESKSFVMKQWQDCEYSQVLLDEIAITARKAALHWKAKNQAVIWPRFEIWKEKKGGLMPAPWQDF